MSPQDSSQSLPYLVSRQISEARRFCLNPAPNPGAALEIVCGGVERTHSEYVVDRSDFPYFAIEFVAEGEGDLTINGRQHVLSAGTVFAYGPETPHVIRNRATHGMRKYYVDFVGTRAPKLLREAGLWHKANNYSAISVGGLHELADVFEMLIREANHSGPMVASICESLTQLLLQKIRQLRLPEGSEMSTANVTYERVRRHIEDHFLRLHTVQDVAHDCNITPVYLSRLFGRFSDCGAYHYLIRRKMNYAAGLLANEGLLVKEVAQRLEFADAFQFSRAFKRIYGISPTKLKSVGRICRMRQ